MLLTLMARCLRPKLTERGSSGAGLRLTDVPAYVRDELGLFGLSISTDLLVGADLAKLDALREAADKASCPCLVLIESEPQALGAEDEDKGEAAVERMGRVVQAAHRLGCNSAAVAVSATDNPDSFDFAVDRLKRILASAERLEVNLLVRSHDGLTDNPDRLTDLIKKVGGFRIGTCPDFERASKSKNPEHYLRRLAPYASALTATTFQFEEADTPTGLRHQPYDLLPYVEAILSVGYQGTLAIEYKGKGDVEAGVARSKLMLEAALGQGTKDA